MNATTVLFRIVLACLLCCCIDTANAQMKKPVSKTDTLRPVIRIKPDNLQLYAGTRIERRQWFPAFSLLMATLKLKINNYTPTAFQYNSNNTYKFHKPFDCTLKLGGRNNEVSQTFDLPATRQNPATIYFTDMRNMVPQTALENGAIKISFRFEAAGHEVLGNCIDNLICGNGIWWFDLDDVQVDIFLYPTVENGKLTYSNAKALVKGRLQSVGFNVVGEILEFLNNQVFQTASNIFTDVLNRADIKAAFTESLNNNIGRLPLQLPSPLRSVVLENSGDLVFNKPGR